MDEQWTVTPFGQSLTAQLHLLVSCRVNVVWWHDTVGGACFNVLYTALQPIISNYHIACGVKYQLQLSSLAWSMGRLDGDLGACDMTFCGICDSRHELLDSTRGLSGLQECCFICIECNIPCICSVRITVTVSLSNVWRKWCGTCMWVGQAWHSYRQALRLRRPFYHSRPVMSWLKQMSSWWRL